jgi:hypothetical protein
MRRQILAATLLWIISALPVSAVCCQCYPTSNAAAKTCLVNQGLTACADIPSKSNNAGLSGYTCDTPLDANACKPASTSGGLCTSGPADATSFSVPGANATSSFNAIVPQLNVPIPGLTFSNNLSIAPNGNQQQSVQVPFIGQYVSAAYRYLIAISVIAAAVMIIYGGFKYILGGTVQSIKSGKQTIIDAVIGLALVFGAYTILNVVSPPTLSPGIVQLTLVKPDPFSSFMGGAQDAPSVLASVGINGRQQAVPVGDIAQGVQQTGDPNNPGNAGPSPQAAVIQGDEIAPPPSSAKSPTNLTIPLNCPGRDSGYDSGTRVMYGGKPAYAKSALAIQLSQDTIKQYLAEQSRTGIPAGVLIAQIMSETGATATSKCIVQNLFNDPAKCGSAPYFKYYNFGGIGCTAGQVGNGACPNLALPASGSACDASDGPNNFNKYNSACVAACSTNPNASSYDCGKGCYPQPSTASGVYNGQYMSWPSIQCSRIFTSAQDFLNSHLGFAQYCLPYNDSVYKFAYCIGASTYASDGNKAAFIAEVIERNCLCGSKDSTGCKRDLNLENALSKSLIKKTNLYKFTKTDTASIIDALSKSTGGALTPTAYIQADNMSRIANPQP